LRSNATRGGAFEDDPYPEFHRLRETGPVHEGIVGELVGYRGEAFFQGLPYPDRRHVSCFDFATCDAVFRDGETFVAGDPIGDDMIDASILFMDGARHRRYRALVQPSFLPARMVAATVDPADRRCTRVPVGGHGSRRPQRRVLLGHPLLTPELRHLHRRGADHRCGHLRRCRDREFLASSNRSSRRLTERRDDLISVRWSRPRSPTRTGQKRR
jgi:hypothetical protein